MSSASSSPLEEDEGGGLTEDPAAREDAVGAPFTTAMLSANSDPLSQDDHHHES